jgi:hypothetical protein
MKKLMILAALGTAALFTACGDDSSSGSSDVCEVTATENSVSLTTNWGGEFVQTWTIDGENITLTYEGYEEAKEPFTYAKGDQTIESLKADAEKGCEETKKMIEEMGG